MAMNMALSRVTYVAEQISVVRRLSGDDVIDDAIEDEAMEDMEAFARKHGSVLIPQRTKMRVETIFEVVPDRVYWLGLLHLERLKVVREDTLYVLGWAWKDVRPEHREKLSQILVRNDVWTIDMLSAWWE